MGNSAQSARQSRQGRHRRPSPSFLSNSGPRPGRRPGRDRGRSRRRSVAPARAEGSSRVPPSPAKEPTLASRIAPRLPRNAALTRRVWRCAGAQPVVDGSSSSRSRLSAKIDRRLDASGSDRPPVRHAADRQERGQEVRRELCCGDARMASVLRRRRCGDRWEHSATSSPLGAEPDHPVKTKWYSAPGGRTDSTRPTLRDDVRDMPARVRFGHDHRKHAPAHGGLTSEHHAGFLDDVDRA